MFNPGTVAGVDLLPYTPKSRREAAERLVKVSQDLVNGQREIIAGLKSIQRPTEAAEKLLREFEVGLERAIEQRNVAATLVAMSEPSN